ncbi:TIR domain-containing protein [Altererythrobacter salegens]|uniref:TIR domain-containing protein n=1 Tax=Croceibacterium salegens TaxID=1737568 RepID=A0A6I4T089_9SPHN|nr:TIR domain-containing protein [Croceibacterium salegens]MXO60840.1 TIR domain-containing protein [Croceibacterium salegens]
MSETDIFVSYSKEDRAKARLVAHCLEREGFHVWWDVELQSGESFDLIIERHLAEAKAVVVLWSPRSVSSRWVRAEASNADRAGKLAPVIIEPCVRPIIFELLHTIDLSHWDGDISDPTWQNFLLDLHRTVQKGANGSGQADQTSHAPGVHPSRSAFPAFSDPHKNAVSDHNETWEATQFSILPKAKQECVHYLQLIVDGRVERQFPVNPLGSDIGRITPADITLSDKQVSRRHCRIEQNGDELLVVDLGSTNGTFIDGVRVSDKTTLPVGSTLMIGACRLVHKLLTPVDS